MADKKEIGVRLAIRSEGKFVNAYLAESTTMDNARLIGSVTRAIERHPDIFAQWKSVMTEILARAVQDIYGKRPEMPERPAPEHEKSGNA